MTSLPEHPAKRIVAGKQNLALKDLPEQARIEKLDSSD